VRRAIPVHPILLAWFPVISLYSANLGIFTYSDLWMPLAVATGITAVLWGLISLLWRDVWQGAMGASTLVVCYIA
jgi:hypothetical protein